jgi:tRNA A37 threonylcarbamoyladenosine biosynthesis protein TsaE
VVEWADRGLAALPAEHVLVEMDHVAPSKRRLRLESRGERHAELLGQFERASALARK